MADPSSRKPSLESTETTPHTSRAHSLVTDLEKQHHPTTAVPDASLPPLELSPSHLSVPPAPSIPNGGLIAWLQVLSGFFIFFNSWGLINSYGVFQSYYHSALLPNETDSNLSWIGSIEAFLLCCTTIFAGPIFDRGYARALVFAGSALVVLGLMMTSLCSKYWHFMLAQGLCIGIGQGCIFIVAIAIIPSYFSTKRSFAMGLAASGSSLGGVVYTILFHRLIEIHHVSFGWTTRIIGFLALATLLVPCAFIRLRTTPRPRKKIVDFDGFKEAPFTVFSLASFVGFIGLYIPFFYITSFSSSIAGLNATLAFYTLPIMSAGSALGRILPGFIADFLGPLNVLSICTLIAGVLGFLWLAIPSPATAGGVIIWSLLYGAFSGAFVSLQPSTVVSITDDMGVVGGRLGMNTFCAALGLLIGTPIAGVILGDGSGWVGLQVFCGVCLLVGGGLVGLTRGVRAGWGVGRRA